MRALHAAFSPLDVTVDELVAEGDKVAVRWRLRGVHSGEFMGLAPTGKEVQLSGINIYRLAAGKIVSNHEQADVAEQMRRLGAV